MVLVALVILAALGAVAASGAATAIADLDTVLRAALATAVTVMAWRAGRWSLLAAAGIALAASGPDPVLFAFALVVFAVAMWAASTDRPGGHLVNAMVGAATFQVLLRLPSWGPTGTSAAVATIGTVTILTAGVIALDPRTRRRVLLGGGALLAAWLVLTALLTASVLLNRSHLDEGVAAARAGFNAARTGDTARAVAKLEEAQRLFRRVEAALDSPWSNAARVVPIVGQQESALRAVTREATELAATGALMAREANVDRLRVANGRMDPAAIAAMHAPLAQVEAVLGRARLAIDATRSPWLFGPIDDRISTLDRAVHDAARAAKTATIGVDASPRLLGVAQPQRYFVMFTTPAEARASGGFMGNWGILTVTNGQFELTEFGRTADLNAAGDAPTKHIDGLSDYVARYGRFRPAQEWRNVNMSPDFPSVARVVEQLYRQSGGDPVDGVIAVDPRGLAQLLRLTGPVRVPGRNEPLTATNAASFLLRDQYLAFGNTDERVDFLESAAHAITTRLTTSSLPNVSVVGRVLGAAARDGHLRAYSFDPTGQRLFRRMGVSGALPSGRNDVFGLVTQNSGGNKIDLFLHRSLDISQRIDPSNGHATATAEIHLRNEAPTTGLPDYVIGNSIDGLPKGTNRMYLSFYTRLGLTGATLDGQPIQLETQREHGLRVYSAFVNVASGANATLRLELSGDATFTKTFDGNEYRLDLWHQSTVNPDDVDVRVALAGTWKLRAPVRGFHLEAGGARYAAPLTHETSLRASVNK
jgi:Protein of unknown function (DUF4012)